MTQLGCLSETTDKVVSFLYLLLRRKRSSRVLGKSGSDGKQRSGGPWGGSASAHGGVRRGCGEEPSCVRQRSSRRGGDIWDSTDTWPAAGSDATPDWRSGDERGPGGEQHSGAGRGVRGMSSRMSPLTGVPRNILSGRNDESGSEGVVYPVCAGGVGIRLVKCRRTCTWTIYGVRIVKPWDLCFIMKNWFTVKSQIIP